MKVDAHSIVLLCCAVAGGYESGGDVVVARFADCRVVELHADGCRVVVLVRVGVRAPQLGAGREEVAHRAVLVALTLKSGGCAARSAVHNRR